LSAPSSGAATATTKKKINFANHEKLYFVVDSLSGSNASVMAVLHEFASGDLGYGTHVALLTVEATGEHFLNVSAVDIEAYVSFSIYDNRSVKISEARLE
jgi:hypothetical protein